MIMMMMMMMMMMERIQNAVTTANYDIAFVAL